MRTANNLDELIKMIKQDTASSFKEDVFPVVQRRMIKHITLDVYGEYQPVAYFRRYKLSSKEMSYNPYDDTSNKGLLSDENIEALFNDRAKDKITMIVVNNTLGSKYYFDKFGNIRVSRNAGRPIAEVIERGKGYDIKKSKYNARYRLPRPFIHNTAVDLGETGDHVKALAKSLRAKGYDVIE